MINKPKYFIDLFAGCGGLSLGLEQAGFEPVLYNELNPSAAETYRINRNPIEYVADIHDIDEKHVIKHKGIDLVCGGPPCQGYSAIGIRRTHKADKQDMARNRLFNEMIRIIDLVEPKLFLFENVRGILTGKWHASGEKGDIFRDILGAFIKKLSPLYHIRWELVKSSNYRVPQNRPRVFIVGIHKSLKYSKTLNDINRSYQEIMEKGFALMDGLLPQPSDMVYAPNLEDLLGDLVDDGYSNNDFETKVYLTDPMTQVQKEIRVKKSDSGNYMKKGEPLTEQVYSRHKIQTVEKFTYMINNKLSIQANGSAPKHFRTKKFSQRLLPPTWDDKKGPTITVTSLPDDYVHYSQPRILTVREWARLQTFPDWYKFVGKRTTGGSRRAGMPHSTADQIEIPKYTQIGNAVPVLLAREFGQHFSKLIGSSNA